MVVVTTPDELRSIVAEAVASALDQRPPITITEPQKSDSTEMVPRADVLRELSVSAPLLRRLEKAGRLKPVRCGRKVLFRRSDLEAFAAGRV